MDLPWDCVGTLPGTPPLNCSTCARLLAARRPPMAESDSSTSRSKEKLMMKRPHLLLLAAAILVAGTTLLLRRASAAGGEVDVIVNKANTIGDLSPADAQKVFMGDKTT